MSRFLAMVLVTLALSVLASLRSIVLYVPGLLIIPAVIGVVIAGPLGCVLLLRGRLRPAWILLLTGLLAIVVAVALYPIADGRRQLGLGSDHDDAVRDTAGALLGGGYPFALRTYLDNPPSPGPVWVLFHVPFVAAGAYIAAPVTAMVVCAWMLTRAAGSLAAAGTAVLVATCPAFWQALAIGSDHLTVGCLTVVLLLLVREVRTGPQALGAAILAMALGTSRAAFPLIPAAVGFLARGTTLGVVATLSGAVASVLIHLAFRRWGPGGYGPMHVFGEAGIMLPGWLAWAGGAATLTGVAVATAIRPRELASQMTSLGVVLAIPLTLMMFARSGEDLSDVTSWGADYVISALVVLAAGAGLQAAELARQPAGKMV